MTYTIRALALPLLVGLANAQDVIYYKFESGGGGKVINYASGDPAAPREGVVFSSLPVAGAWGRGSP